MRHGTGDGDLYQCRGKASSVRVSLAVVGDIVGQGRNH
jgi:hypothetical protein